MNISTNSGSSWTGVQGLTPKNGQVDYPIGAAAKTPAGPTNVYAAWVDSQSGDVKFKQSSDGGTTWSATVVIGTTHCEDHRRRLRVRGLPRRRVRPPRCDGDERHDLERSCAARQKQHAQLDDEPSLVVASGHVYGQYNAYKSNHHHYDAWGSERNRIAVTHRSFGR